jgi:hypothetical protein
LACLLDIQIVVQPPHGGGSSLDVILQESQELLIVGWCFP